MRKKKKSVFGRFFIAYVLLLAVCCVAALFYVRDSLILYENAQSDVYMEDFVAKLSGGELAEKAEEAYLTAAAPGKFDDAEMCRQAFADKMKGAAFFWKPDPMSYDTSTPIYDVYADGELLLKVTLQAVNAHTRLGIMAISDWETAGMEICPTGFGGELPGVGKRFDYTISVPDIYSVYVNGAKLGAEELSGERLPIDEFQYVSEYVKMPELISYRVEGLAFEPEIVIRDLSGEEVEYEVKNGNVTTGVSFHPNAAGEEFEGQIDVLRIAKLWSSFLTDDLTGAKHGVGQVLPYLIPDSYLYEMANDYARGVDITFISGHVLNGFSEERVSDYIKYGEDCFSCEVYFEKNMTLLKGGKRMDAFHNRMYFVYIEDTEIVPGPGWYLADMQAVIGVGGQ